MSRDVAKEMAANQKRLAAEERLRKGKGKVVDEMAKQALKKATIAERARVESAIAERLRPVKVKKPMLPAPRTTVFVEMRRPIPSASRPRTTDHQNKRKTTIFTWLRGDPDAQ